MLLLLLLLLLLLPLLLPDPLGAARRVEELPPTPLPMLQLPWPSLLLLLLLPLLATLLLLLPLLLLSLLLLLPPLSPTLLLSSSLGLGPPGAARAHACPVSLSLGRLLLLLLPRPPLPLVLGLSEPVPVLAGGPACGEASGVSTSGRMSPVALLVPADVVPPDCLAELLLFVVSLALHLGSNLNL